MAHTDPDPISQAVRDEERALLAALPEEPAYLRQVMALFDGRAGWANAAMFLAQGVLFLAGAWLAWLFFHQTEVIAALRLGLSAAVLLLMSLIIKMAFLPTMRLEMVRRDLKRLAAALALREGR